VSLLPGCSFETRRSVYCRFHSEGVVRLGVASGRQALCSLHACVGVEKRRRRKRNGIIRDKNQPTG
ncbi:hypothetical protein PENTCL1PPCAC_1357, partial [Pristionchus entomophagus]